jgi:ElaB/YqjD/DUF883 family membrane-anchored ribosome-binding protein
MAAKKKAGSGATQARAAGRATTADLDDLVSDLEALRADVRSLAQGVGSEAGERISEALKSAEDRLASLVSAAEDVAADAVDQAEAWANENVDSLRESVREQPIAACLIALGAGALLGAILFRR